MALLDLALEGMAVFGFVLFLVLWLMHFMAIIYTRLHLNKKATDKQPYSKLPGVSLLKPLKGVDPNLINNLETFFELDYPKVSTVLYSQEWTEPYLFFFLTYSKHRGILTWYQVELLKIYNGIGFIKFML